MKNDVYALENITHLPDVSLLADSPVVYSGFTYRPQIPDLREEGIVRYTPALTGIAASNPFFREMTVRELPEGLGARYGITARGTRAGRAYTVLLIIVMLCMECVIYWIVTRGGQENFRYGLMMPPVFIVVLFTALALTKRLQIRGFAKQFEARMKELSPENEQEE